MKRLIAAVLTATTMTLAACTATGGPDPETTSGAGTSTAAPTSTRASTPDPVSSWLFGTTTSSPPSSTSKGTVDPTTAPSTSVTTGDVYDAIPVTIPDSITGADLKIAKQGVAVWRNAMRVFDESLQDPAGKDWKTAVYRYANDPAALKQMALVSTFVKQGIHQVDEPGYTAEVFEADAHSVKIRACLDITKFDVLDKDGRSVVQSDGPPRIRRDYWLGFYQGSDDLYVGLVDIPDPAQPC